MTETLTDIQGLVDGAYSEMECASRQQQVGHGGEVVAFFDQHGCYSGPMCRTHYERVTVGDIRESFKADLQYQGFITCKYCPGRFTSIDAFARYYPL